MHLKFIGVLIHFLLFKKNKFISLKIENLLSKHLQQLSIRPLGPYCNNYIIIIIDRCLLLLQDDTKMMI